MIKIRDTKQDGTIPVMDMEDGDVAVITAWIVEAYIGRVVQRYGDYLVAMGMPAASGWGKFFTNVRAATGCRVRLLPPGTLLEVA